MSWMITYAVSSTMIALLVIATEKRFRPEWREALLWFAVLAPILIASATLISAAPANTSGLSTLAPTISIAAPSIHVTPRATLDIGLVAVIIWIVVALSMFARDLILHRRLIVALDRKQAAHGSLATVAARLRIRRHIKLTMSESLPVPIAIGSREICVPASLLQSTAGESLEPIFAHELAHLLRRDPQLQQIARLIAVVLWWQPLNRVVARRLAAVAELRADALCSSVVPPTRIAKTLLLFAQQSRSPQVAGMPAFPAGLLKERIAHLLSDSRPASPLVTRLAACALLVFGALGVLPRFDILGAQIPAMFSPLVVKASQIAAVPVRESTSVTPAVIHRQPPPEAEPRDQDVVAALTQLLNDSEKHVRSAARESLRRIGTPESLDALSNDRFAQSDSTKEIR